jgi:competence protein ComEC
VRTHPRHVALAAAATGIALAPAPTVTRLATAGVLAAALSLLTAPRAAVFGAAALLAGAVAGDARIAAVDSAGEGLDPGDRVEGRAHLLSVPRAGPFGSSAEARMSSGHARDARLLVRFPRDARPAPGAGIGAEVRLAGSVRPVKPAAEGEFDLAAYLRRRGLAGELDAERLEVTGRRRGGMAGVIDAMRRRAEDGIAGGLSPGSLALARGMVLGQDEAIDPAVRDDFRASGLAHVLTYQHQDRRRVCEPFGFRMESFGWSHSTVSEGQIGLQFQSYTR